MSGELMLFAKGKRRDSVNSVVLPAVLRYSRFHIGLFSGVA